MVNKCTLIGKHQNNGQLIKRLECDVLQYQVDQVVLVAVREKKISKLEQQIVPAAGSQVLYKPTLDLAGGAGGLPQCMLGYTPPGCGPGDLPPGQTPQLPPWVWAWKPARHAGIPSPGKPAERHAGIPPPPPPPLVNRITDTCKNITLPQLRCGR